MMTPKNLDHELKWIRLESGSSYIYLKGYETVPALAAGLDDYFQLYNYLRPHQSLGYRTPADVHFAVEAPVL